MCMTSGETATAFDLKIILKDLMPCKYAAIRLCAWPQQVSTAALWKCGATLAAAPQRKSASGVWPSLNGMAQLYQFDQAACFRFLRQPSGPKARRGR